MGLSAAIPAALSAASSASAPAVTTLGVTPVPSQFVPVTGFVTRPVGTNAANSPGNRTSPET